MTCLGLEVTLSIFSHQKKPFSSTNSTAAVSSLHLELFACDLLHHILKEMQFYTKTFDKISTFVRERGFSKLIQYSSESL